MDDGDDDGVRSWITLLIGRVVYMFGDACVPSFVSRRMLFVVITSLVINFPDLLR